MKLSYKILLYTTNHITGNLIYLKLKSYGHNVLKAEAGDFFTEALARKPFDLIIVDDSSDSSSEIASLVSGSKTPCLYVSGKKSTDAELEKITLKLSFSEEELMLKISYLTEYKEKVKLPLIEAVSQHYAGDLELTQKVVHSFLKVWQSSLEDIGRSFEEDEDDALARKIHSFKGVLSALGETEAAAMVRKMEILIKGRRRKNAANLYQQLHGICLGLSEELERSALFN